MVATPLTPARRRQKSGASLELQASQGCTVRPCLKRRTEKKVKGGREDKDVSQHLGACPAWVRP